MVLHFCVPVNPDPNRVFSRILGLELKGQPCSVVEVLRYKARLLTVVMFPSFRKVNLQ